MNLCASCRHFRTATDVVTLGLNLPVTGQCRRYPPSVEVRRWGPNGMRPVFVGPTVGGDDPACGEFAPEPQTAPPV